MTISIDDQEEYKKDFDSYGNWPVSWYETSEELAAATKLLEQPVIDYFEDNRDSDHPGRLILAPYYMMSGYLLECLLKGILVATGYKCVEDGKFTKQVNGHTLIDLAKKAKISFTPPEELILKLLSAHTVWAGRYPIPKNWNNMGIEIGTNEAVTIGYEKYDIPLIKNLIFRAQEKLDLLMKEGELFLRDKSRE